MSSEPEVLDRDALVAAGDRYDQAVLATPDLSIYCSASDWAFSAHERLHVGARLVARTDGEHWLVLAAGGEHWFGGFLHPLESFWGFCCPLLGPDPDRSIDLLEGVLARRPGPVLLQGIGVDSPLFERLVARLGTGWRLRHRVGLGCSQIRLDAGGVEGYLRRRSRKFRAVLRAAGRKVARAGIEFEFSDRPDDVDAVFDRIRRLERIGWKEAAGEGIFQGPRFVEFYRDLLGRAAAGGRLRVVFARLGRSDVAYSIGGVLGSVFRGLQMGFDQAHADLGIGNETQLFMMARMADEGIATYDLGMVTEYKLRWEDRRLRLVDLLVAPA